ncbi:MAG: helix-turn-helix domain-containing protein [Candidatus Pacebacteria bacterium]|jgi:DNA-binding XRE family transcriptional regulator|nr:helix-turn-helix domain-containing protein [Candidatus Paceibacterota bacterium]
MANAYFDFIKQSRIARDISQAEMAQKLGISRATYIAIEQGERDLSLEEAQKLADIFGIPLDNLKQGMAQNYEKYKQMILAYLRHAANSDGQITKTKLAKLLYLADFGWFYKKLQSMSGMQYRKIQYGPVPDMYFRALDEMEDNGQIAIDRTADGPILISKNEGRSPDKNDQISEAELSLIKKISDKWKDKKTNEIVAFTHNQLPYKICEENEIIPYGLITQEDPDFVF